jgi:16S rRNA G966 N2-methylase RsmD
MFQDYGPFDDDMDDFGELSRADAPLQLDKTLLLDRLKQIESASSIELARRAVADLKEQIHTPGSKLLQADRDRVELDPAYLSGELGQIASSRTLERARYYVRRLIKGITRVRTSLINDINLNRWKEYEHIITDSLWIIDRRDSSGAHTAGYWGNFIPTIPRQMMLRYTKKGEWVLDPFAGSGTTLIEGQRLGRHTIGIELQADVVEHTRRLIASEPNKQGVVSEIVIGDSRTVDYRALLERHDQHSVQLVIMHPPYFDIIKFSDDPRDLCNAASVQDFLEQMGTIVDKARAVLDQGRYLALVIGDKYARGEWIPLGFLTMNEITQRGFVLKSIIVKNFEETTGKRDQKELWRYRALVGGFYIFKHEYIFVFKKQ